MDCHLISSFQSAMHVHCLRSVVHRQDEKLVETSRDATYGRKTCLLRGLLVFGIIIALEIKSREIYGER